MQPRNNTTLISSALYSARNAALAVEIARDNGTAVDSQVAQDAVADYLARRDEVLSMDVTPDIRDLFAKVDTAIEEADVAAIEVALDIAGVKKHPTMAWLEHIHSAVSRHEAETAGLRTQRTTVARCLLEAGFTREQIAQSLGLSTEDVAGWLETAEAGQE